jgi:hypothetical protein
MSIDSDRHLPEIPVVELGAGHALALLEAERVRAEALLAGARARYPAVAVRLGDRLSRRWLEKGANPYLHEVRGVAERLGVPGAYFLNVNHEWGCTSAVGPAPEGPGSRLIRVLDWPFDGLGAHLVAARIAGPAGPWLNLTWPGFVGCVQGLAPGRFAAAFHQAPMRRRTPVMPLDWALNRAAVWRGAGLPPAHLLRRAFETCADYDSAKALLAEAPLALPTIFLLSGPGPGQGCVIERLEDRAQVRAQPAAAANHWTVLEHRAAARGEQSRARQAMMAARQARAGADFAWLEAPVLNETTRLVMIAEPANGRLVARGFEAQGPATRTLAVDAADTGPGGA